MLIYSMYDIMKFCCFQVNAKQMSNMAINNDNSTTIQTNPVGVKIATKTLKTKEVFVCGPPDLYRVFTEKEVNFIKFV